MLTKTDILLHRDQIMALAASHGASNVRLFGSVARGDPHADSDVDLVVRFEPGRSLFDHGELLMDLRDLLGVKVDVVSENGLRDQFREQVWKEAVPL